MKVRTLTLAFAPALALAIAAACGDDPQTGEHAVVPVSEAGSDVAAQDAGVTDASCASLRGVPEPGLAPFSIESVGPFVARDDRTLFGVAYAPSCGEIYGAPQLTRLTAKTSGTGATGPIAAERADLCFGQIRGTNGGTILAAYSRSADRIGAVALSDGFSANIVVAVISPNDPAWSATPEYSEAQKFVEYPELGRPDAGDAGLISGERVAAATAAIFLGSNLLVVGQTGDVGLTVLFKETGQPNPKALAGSALVETRVTLFQAAAAIEGGGAWAAGPTSGGRVGLVKLTQNNALDGAFGGGGFIEVGAVGEGTRVHGIGVDALGRLLIVRTTTTSGADAATEPVTSSPSIMRLTQAGAVDPTFGAGGVAQVPLLTSGPAGLSVIVEPGGGVLVGGAEASSRRAAIARLDRDGKVDPAFGGPGSGGLATQPFAPGKAPDVGPNTGSVLMALTPQSNACKTKFFALFAQQDGRGYVFE